MRSSRIASMGAALAALVLVLVLAFALGYAAAASRYNPHCPLEDSCEIDYAHGYWTITIGNND